MHVRRDNAAGIRTALMNVYSTLHIFTTVKHETWKGS